MRHSLNVVGTRCPMVLVLDDLRREAFSPEAVSLLRSAYGKHNIVYLTHLYGRVLNFTASHSVQLAPRGRRLLSSSSVLSRMPRAAAWGSTTHQKLLVWALPGLHRAVFLDLDLLILRNIDGLTFERLPPPDGTAPLTSPDGREEPFSAVAALPYSTKFFNSGVFAFRPSLATAAALYQLSGRATFKKGSSTPPTALGALPPVLIKAALERFHLTDQSVLNHYFKGRWRPLPFGFNAGVKIRSADRKLWNQLEVAVIHFVAAPKPWELVRFDTSTTDHVQKAGLWPLHLRWRRQCNFTVMAPEKRVVVS